MNFLDKISLINDIPRPWGLYFKDNVNTQVEALIELHDNIMFYLAIILFGVAWIIASIIINFVSNKSSISNKYLNNGILMELILTVTPALILILIAFPSFKLLYLMDEVTDPSLTVFVEGHQWYWSYQYPDFLSEDNEELVDYISLSEPSSSIDDVIHQYIYKHDAATDTMIQLEVVREDGFYWLVDTNDPSGARLQQFANNPLHVKSLGSNGTYYAAIKGFTDVEGSKWTFSAQNYARFSNSIQTSNTKLADGLRTMSIRQTVLDLKVKW